MNADDSLVQLRTQVSERLAFLKQIFGFVENFVLANGVETGRDTTSGTTKVVRQLRDYNGLTIVWTSGHWGNESVEVYAGPSVGEGRLAFCTSRNGNSDNSYSARKMSSAKGWQERLEYLLVHAEEILEDKKRAEVEKRSKLNEEQLLALERVGLNEQARKLGLL